MFYRFRLFIAMYVLLSCNRADQQKADEIRQADSVLVTAGNFARAESDMYFASAVKMAGGLGKFHHHRELMDIGHQTVVRTNRDVLYSSIIFDLNADSVTIVLPNPGGRFMSMMAIDEDQYATATVYAPGTYTYSKSSVGTRYVMMAVRTFVNPDDPADMEKARALQDAILVKQRNSGIFEIPAWDSVSQKKVRDSLVLVSATIKDAKGMFGPRGEVDPVRHLIGTATGWGGNAEKDAMYVTTIVHQNDGRTNYKLTVPNVPVDGFWSVSVYNKDGYFERNALEAYSLNNITAKKDADGVVTIWFGGCDGKKTNCIPIFAGWNYWVRLYRPRPEILNGTWKFPEAKQVN